MRAKRKILFWISATLVVVLLSALGLMISGTVVVVDKHVQVTSAKVVNGSQEQELFRLPGSVFVGIPEIEGSIELSCPDGTVQHWGYVTGHFHTWLKVSPGQGCGKLTDIQYQNS